jgi:hypothetical protein
MASQNAAWLPKSQADKDAVREQMGRILAHPAFRNSVRSAKVLRYCIEQSLEGNGPHLKERTIGIEVFGRNPEYDTNQDTIVRAAASDVRRRIAQYYHEPGRETELAIDLPAFAYTPEFHLPHGVPAEQVRADPPSSLFPALPLNRRKLLIAISIPIVVILVVLAATLVWRAPGVKSQQMTTSAFSSAQEPVGTTLDNFWQPILEHAGTMLICTGESPMDSRGIGTALTKPDYGPRNAIAIAQLAKFLGRRGKPILVKQSNSTNASDMRQAPAILISGQTNFWTLRETDPLRFHFAGGPEAGAVWIEDRENPAQRKWSISLPGTTATTDYAIAARMLDSATGNWVIVAAGLGENGTTGAAHCLIDTSCLNEILKSAPRNWASKNLEVVVRADVGSESPDAPQVMAVNFW